MATNSQGSQDSVNYPRQQEGLEDENSRVGSAEAEVFSSAEAEKNVQLQATHHDQEGEGQSKQVPTYYDEDASTVVVTASNANGHGLAADQFPSSEEETTPGGGIKELVVGHVRKIVRLNNAQLVIPDLAPTPPNIVAGCSLNSIHVRCQGKIFDNN